MAEQIAEQAARYLLRDTPPHRFGGAAAEQFRGTDLFRSGDDILLAPLATGKWHLFDRYSPFAELVEGWLLSRGILFAKEAFAAWPNDFAALAKPRSPCFTATRFAALAITSAAAVGNWFDIFPLPFYSKPLDIPRFHWG